jgi:imidazolonepropionase-like amidohydrolase
MPGLVDAHVHVGDATELLLHLRHGVTTVFNLGGDYIDLFADERVSVMELRSAVESGAIPGPTIYSTGTSLDGTPATGPFQRALGSPGEASQAVREQATAGYDFIKVYDAMSAELLAAVVAAADSAGLPVFGHVPDSVGAIGALESGIDVITHAEEFWQYFSDAPEQSELAALAEVIAQSGVWVIPNTAFIRRLVLQLQNLEAQLARPDVRHLHPRVRVWWDPQYNYYVNRDDPENFERAMARRYEWLIPFVTELHEAGVPLLAGSDAPVPVALPGFGLDRRGRGAREGRTGALRGPQSGHIESR